MPHTTHHTPQWELSSKHRDEQYIDEPLAEELRPLFRIHWDNNVSDTEAEQGAALIAAAPAMYGDLCTVRDYLLELYDEGNARAGEYAASLGITIEEAEGQHHE